MKPCTNIIQKGFFNVFSFQPYEASTLHMVETWKEYPV